MSDIFISYTKQDRSRTKEVASRLEQEGWSVFWDRTIPVGETWNNILVKELSIAKVLVVLWSNKSIISDYVLEEAAEGKKRGILAPGLLENVEIPFGFKLFQSADISDWKSGESDTVGMRLLLDAIARIGHLTLYEKNADKWKQKVQKELNDPMDIFPKDAPDIRNIGVAELAGEVELEAFDYYLLGQAKYKQGDFSGAIFNFNQSIKIDPENEEAYCSRGDAKCGQQDYSGAISDYTKAIEINPEFEEAYCLRGLSKDRDQDYSGAISDYTKAIKIDPEYTIAYCLRGNSKYEQKDYSGAISDYTKAINSDPEYADAYWHRGSAKLIGLNDNSGACKDWKLAKAKGSVYADIDLLKKYCK